MTHVFISYSHKDGKERLQRLIAALTKAGFDEGKDIWYDKNIESGGKWRPQIDTALEESFAVAVVLTPESMQSLYVTYEWSWAIGSSTPLFPLLFDGSYEDLHKRLLDEQVEDCREYIPGSMIETISNHRRISPATRRLHQLITNTVAPFRILSRVALWLSPYSLAEVVSIDVFGPLLAKAIKEGRKVQDSTLPELMVDKSHAFTTRQRRVCDDYIEKLDRGVDLLHAIFLLGNESQASTVSAAEKHRSEILEPVIAEIDPYGPFTNYNLLDSYLDDIAQNRLRSNRTLFSPDYESLVVFLQRFLQDQDANNIWDALETVRINVTAQE